MAGMHGSQRLMLDGAAIQEAIEVRKGMDGEAAFLD